MTQMALIHQQRYPKAFTFLANDLPGLPSNDAGTWNAFLRHAHLDPAEAAEALSMGSSPPLVFASDLGSAVWGLFDPEIPGRVEISIDVLQAFEGDDGNPAARQFLRAKVLHELCHWACFRRQLPDRDEAGEAFENDVFGGELRPWWLDGERARPEDADVFRRAETRAEALRLALATNELLQGRLDDPQHAVFAGGDVAEGMPRGYRNNNPGNIRVGDPWQGLADPVMQTEFQRRERSFCVFREPEWGLRAMAYLLRRYQFTHGLDTPRKIIGRWAPAADNNNVNAYSARVAGALGIAPDDTLDTRDDATLTGLLRAMARHENGDAPPYAEVQYGAALLLLR